LYLSLFCGKFSGLYFHHFDDVQAVIDVGKEEDEFQYDRIFENSNYWEQVTEPVPKPATESDNK
jgi:hypothetical protein